MKNFIEVIEDNSTVLVNVSQISKVIWSNEEGVIIYLNGGYEVRPECEYMRLKQLIDESYL